MWLGLTEGGDHDVLETALDAEREEDPAGRVGAILVSFVALDDLSARGPFAPIFFSAQQPEQPVDWLGQPRPQKHENDGLH
jgi:hypothetical protein